MSTPATVLTQPIADMMVRAQEIGLEVHLLTSPSVWDPSHDYDYGMFLRNRSQKAIRLQVPGTDEQYRIDPDGEFRAGMKWAEVLPTFAVIEKKLADSTPATEPTRYAFEAAQHVTSEELDVLIASAKSKVYGSYLGIPNTYLVDGTHYRVIDAKDSILPDTVEEGRS